MTAALCDCFYKKHEKLSKLTLRPRIMLAVDDLHEFLRVDFYAY